MPVLRSLDLFSGLGGISIGLHGIAKPVCYCELDETCRTLLAAKMRNGLLPRAKVFKDVRSLRGKDIGGKGSVDIIVGGWPCQDLSVIGKRRGLKGSRSGLIYEVMRLTDELCPKMLFLENVPPLVHDGLGDLIGEFVLKRGYELRWIIMPASAIGAPHNRKRWYGMIIRKDAINQQSWLLNKHTPFDWRREPVARMVLPRDMNEKKQMQALLSRLGNSVVPDAVRAAFIILSSGFRIQIDDVWGIRRLRVDAVDNTGLQSVNIASRGLLKKTNYSNWGIVHSNGNYTSKEMPVMKVPSLNLEYNPKAYSGVVVGRVSSGKIEGVVHGRSWSTPRYTVPMCNVLTRRSVRDLSTQVRFERGTPDHLRSGMLNPCFVSWLMGMHGC